MSQSADNFRFDITAWRGHYADGRDILAECLRLAFDQKTASHWSSDGKRLILFWTAPDARFSAQAFISKASPESLVVMIRDWLAGVEYPKEPDHDGDNSKGFRVFNEAWGHVEGESYAICGIEPAWLMHGK